MLKILQASLQQYRKHAHRDPGEWSSDPTRDGPRLACERPGVSGGGVGQQCPVAGPGALSVAGCTPVFLPRESHGQRSLEGYTFHGVTESDTTEAS